MIKYLDIVLSKFGLIRIAAHKTEVANLNARIVELKRCTVGNAVGMYG